MPVRGLAVATLLVLVSRPVVAQVLQTPGRPLRGLFSAGPPPDPDKPWQTVTFSAATLGGYDNNLTPQQDSQSGAFGAEPFTAAQPGYMGYADGAFQYQRGQKRQHLDAEGRAFVNSYRNLGVTPSYGGSARINLVTPVGRRTDFDARAEARTDPFYALGTFRGLEGVVGEAQLPDVRPSSGFLIRRSWSGDAGAGITSQVSRQNTISASYRYDQRTFEDQIGDNDIQTGSVRFGHGFGRHSGLDLTYQRAHNNFHETIGDRPLTTDDMSVGYRHQYDRSATRHVSVSFGAGAQYAQTVNGATREAVDYTLPSGYADVHLDLARTWNLSANYRRGASTVDGLSAETFTSDAALVQLAGLVHRRVELTFSSGFSRGGRSAGSELGAYTNYGGTTQVLYRMGRWSALALSHSYYAYRLTDFSTLPMGLPARLDRNSIRVGFTMMLPLYGTTPDVPQSGRRD